jgi:hypothetical protein
VSYQRGRSCLERHPLARRQFVASVVNRLAGLPLSTRRFGRWQGRPGGILVRLLVFLPSQGEGRWFESRRPLQQNHWLDLHSAWSVRPAVEF